MTTESKCPTCYHYSCALRHADKSSPGVKRKASEEPSSPSAAKRLKNEAGEPEKKPVMKPIPFPEKVS